MSSLDTAIAILGCFAPETPELAITDVARRLNMPKSTVSRLMKAMADGGLVEQHEVSRRYRVGLVPFRLGQLYQSHLKVLELMEAEVAGLVEETGFTVYVCVLNGADIVILRMQHGRYPVRMMLEPGYRVAAFSTAVGKALLARQSDTELRKLLPQMLVHENTSLKKPLTKLLHELSAVREQLWAEASEETFPGMSAIAAASGSADGQQQAVGISVSFPVNVVSPRDHDRMVELVTAAAARVAVKTFDPIWSGAPARLQKAAADRVAVRLAR